jgi:hypothetical protein
MAAIMVSDSSEKPRFTRPWATVTAGVLAISGVLQFLGSRFDSDPAIRDAWVQDLVGSLSASLFVAVMAFGVAVWARPGSRRRQTGAVIGLSIAAMLITPVLWFSAAPVIIAAAAIQLGVTTGVTTRDGGSTTARSLTLLAGMSALAALVVTVAGTLLEVM